MKFWWWRTKKPRNTCSRKIVHFCNERIGNEAWHQQMWDERWANVFHACFSGNKTLSFVHNSNNYSFGNDHRCRVDWPPDARTTRTSYKYNSVIPWCCTSTAIRWQWPLRPCCFVFAPDWQTHESNLIFDYLSIVEWQGCLEVTWAITWAISHLRCMATVWLRTDEHITGSDGQGWMFSGIVLLRFGAKTNISDYFLFFVRNRKFDWHQSAFVSFSDLGDFVELVPSPCWLVRSFVIVSDQHDHLRKLRQFHAYENSRRTV